MNPHLYLLCETWGVLLGIGAAYAAFCWLILRGGRS